MKAASRFLILIIGLFFSISILAQDAEQKKSQEEIKNMPIENKLVKQMWDSLWVYNETHRYYESLPILYRLEKEALEAKEHRVYAHTLENIATLHFFKGEVEESIVYYQKAFNAHFANGEKSGLAAIMASISKISFMKGDVKSALQQANKAKDLLKYSNTKNTISSVYNDLGSLYYSNGQFDSSYHYQKIVLETIDPNDLYTVATANINMASSFMSMHDYEKAEKYLNDAYKVADKEQFPLTYATVIGQIGQLENLKNNHQEAETKLVECIKVLEGSKNSFQRLFRFYPIYADILICNNKFGEAESILAKANPLIQDDNQELKIAYYFPKWQLSIINGDVQLAKEVYAKIRPLYREGQLMNKVRFYSLECRHFKLLGDEKSALKSLELNAMAKDTLRSILNLKAVENLEIKYDSQKKDIEIVTAKSRIQFQRYGLLFGGTMLLSLGFLLFRNSRNRKKIEVQNNLISKSLKEKEILLKEIHHRVKNNLQVISSLLSIQSRSIKNEKAKEAILEGKARVHSMSLIHQDLYKKDNLTGVRMDRYLGNLTRDLLDTYNISEGKISLSREIQPLKLDVESVIPLGLIVNELMSNALKYAFPENRDGNIDVVLKEENGILHLSVADNGVGLDTDQLKAKRDSFGHTLIRAFRNKLDAEIDIASRQGTIVHLKIANYKKVV